MIASLLERMHPLLTQSDSIQANSRRVTALGISCLYKRSCNGMVEPSDEAPDIFRPRCRVYQVRSRWYILGCLIERDSLGTMSYRMEPPNPPLIKLVTERIAKKAGYDFVVPLIDTLDDWEHLTFFLCAYVAVTKNVPLAEELRYVFATSHTDHERQNALYYALTA